ncbi:hypothetical protein D3C80_1718380 [compost metagenome]
MQHSHRTELHEVEAEQQCLSSELHWKPLKDNQIKWPLHSTSLCASLLVEQGSECRQQ